MVGAQGLPTFSNFNSLDFPTIPNRPKSPLSKQTAFRIFSRPKKRERTTAWRLSCAAAAYPSARSLRDRRGQHHPESEAMMKPRADSTKRRDLLK
jgi:hypothetical protein